MAKNRRFKIQYMITVEGTTSNGFQAELFDNIIRGVSQSLSMNSQQCKATVKVLDSIGDFDAEARAMRGESETQKVE